MLFAYFNLRFAERIVPGMPCLVPVLVLDALMVVLLLYNRRRAE